MAKLASEPQGCLASILALFGFRLTGQDGNEELPYRLRDDFLSAAEFSFFRVLVSAVGSHAVVCPKVNLADIVYVAGGDKKQSYRNKIDRKHVDFLLCDPRTMKPRLGIELDDASHERGDRQKRDQFVDEVFRTAGLPLLRVPAQSGYNPSDLMSQIALHLEVVPDSRPTPPPVSAGPPVCPKCGVPMVLRTASRGNQAGQQFYGCQNYPKCREAAGTS